MPTDYDLYGKRQQVGFTPIFWDTVAEWAPPSAEDTMWLLLEIEIDKRFDEAIEAISASK